MSRYKLTATMMQKEVSDDHLKEIITIIIWREVGWHLPGITQKFLNDLDDDCKTSNLKREKLVNGWHDQNGSKATYDVMIKAMIKAKTVNGAEKVCELLCSQKGHSKIVFILLCVYNTG